MAYIGKEPIVGNFQKCDAITVVNGQAAYTLQVSSTNVVPESANHMLVSLNGILQAPVTSFSVSGSTLTFVSNLATGDVIDFVILLGNVLDLGTPSDGTVTNAKLAQDIISGETALASTPADTDEFLVSDAGTLKRIDYSLIKGGGKIGQVVSATKTDYFATTSASLVDVTGVQANITCSATSSKVLVIITGTIGKDNSGNFHLSLLRDTTELMSPVWDSEHPNTNYDYMFTLSYLDSPSSTSALDYQLQTKQDSGTTTINSRSGSPANRGETTITLMEVLA